MMLQQLLTRFTDLQPSGRRPHVVHADNHQGVAGAAEKRVTSSEIVHNLVNSQRETTSDRRIGSTAGRKSN